MRNYTNIERSVLPHVQYVGYSRDGRVWHITGQYGDWLAVTNRYKVGRPTFLRCPNLDALSKELEALP